MYQPNYERIARKIIQESLQVEPGSQLLIETRVDAVQYAEFIAIEAAKVGASPTVMLSSDNLRYQQIMLTPVAQLELPEKPLIAAIEAVDYFINVGMFRSDPARFKNMPKEREQAFHKRRSIMSQAVFGEKGGVWLGTGYPTRQMAAAFNIPWGRLYEMYWRSMDIDYGAMRELAATLHEALSAAEHIHLTTPMGTDVRMRRGDREVFKLDGRIEKYGNLPAGEVYLAPIETSVEGTVVIDRAYDNGQPIVNLELQVEEGIVTPIGATRGFDTFLHVWNVATGDKNRFGEVGIGINPFILEPTGFPLTDEKVMGTVHMALGRNSWAGGENQSTIHWDMVVLRPTLLLDDRMIMQHGRFLL